MKGVTVAIRGADDMRNEEIEQRSIMKKVD